MRRKLLFMIAVLFLLSGCQKDFTFSEKKLADRLQKAAEIKMPITKNNNCHKEYYSFYLFSEMGKEDSDTVSSVLNINSQQAVLTLDIAGIIADNYYQGEDSAVFYLRDYTPETKVIYQTKGRVEKSDDNFVSYNLYIGEFSDTKYLLTIQSSEFIIISAVDRETVYDMSYEMIKLLRSCSVDKEKVLTDFYTAYTFESVSSSITLFNIVLPENGVLKDYIDDWKNDPNFTIFNSEPEINNEEDDEEKGEE